MITKMMIRFGSTNGAAVAGYDANVGGLSSWQHPAGQDCLHPSQSRPGLAGRRILAGFTLIELLVVIAIMSLLMSILAPSLNRAREQARTAVCLSNLRGQGLGVQLYAEDNRGYFPVYERTTGVHHDPAWLENAWPCDIAPYVGEDSQMETHWSHRYWTNSVFNCPSLRTSTDFSKRWLPPRQGIAHGVNYFLHYVVQHDWPYDHARIPTWRNPCQKVAFGDTNWRVLLHQQGSGYGEISWLRFRHLNKTNLLFLDWHAGSFSDVPWAYDHSDDRWRAWWWRDG